MTTINLTQALCFTLFHSLWQGFFAAVAAGIIILSTRKSGAALRYNLLTADLVLFLLAVGFTFANELNGSGPAVGAVRDLEETGVLSGIALPMRAGATSTPGIVEQAGAFLHMHAPTVVIIWMLCLLGQLVQLMGGLYQLGRLRSQRVFPPAAVWQERLQVLARQLGIEKRVDLIQSIRVSVPVTFGFLKPSILVPLGMLTNLPADQVETILLHELAHIRRNDYLANLLLHITEAVFFFNPGVRWVASLIREEREASCDDMVLMGTADRSSYFDALVAFQEYAVSRQGYVLQLGKGKMDLMWRIRRMLNQENKKLHIMEKAILSFGLMAILLIGLISMRAAGRQAEKRQAATLAVWQATDTLPRTADSAAKRVKVRFPSIITRVEDNGNVKKYKIDATDAGGNTFALTKVNGAVTELIINGKTIPEKDFDQYLYIFEEIENRHHETAEEQGDEDKTAIAERDLERAQERLDAANQEQAEAQERLEQEQSRQQEIMEKQQEATEKQQEAQQEAMEKQQEAQQEAREKQQEAQQEAMEKQQEAQQEALEKQQEELEKRTNSMEQEQIEVQEHSRNNADRMIRQIMRDLIEGGVIGSIEEIHSFSLDNKGLTLNGVRQPDEVYQEFREKYIKSANEHYIYSRSGTGTTTDVKMERN